MSPQVHSVEVNTKIPYTFINNKTLLWYKENSCIDGPQKNHALSSKPGNELLYWEEIGHFHLNTEGSIPVVLYPYAIEEMLQIDKVDSLTNGLENFVAGKFFIIPEVEYVFLSLENDSTNIWTVINKLDRKVRERIYDIEYDIFDILKGLKFDFHVICRNDRTIEELYPSKASNYISKIANLKTYAK